MPYNVVIFERSVRSTLVRICQPPVNYTLDHDSIRSEPHASSHMQASTSWTRPRFNFRGIQGGTFQHVWSTHSPEGACLTVKCAGSMLSGGLSLRSMLRCCTVSSRYPCELVFGLEWSPFTDKLCPVQYPRLIANSLVCVLQSLNGDSVTGRRSDSCLSGLPSLRRTRSKTTLASIRMLFCELVDFTFLPRQDDTAPSWACASCLIYHALND